MAESTRPHRPAARRSRAHSEAESPGAIPLKLGEQLTLLFPGNSVAADRARLSTYAAVREIMAVMDGFLAGCSAVDDWSDACLIPDDAASFDQDAAAASHWHFCNLIGLPWSDRISHADLVKSLIAAGYTEGRSPDGRAFHRGARLVDKFGGAVPVAGVMPVGVFIAECCALGQEFRAKASEIHEAYTLFARSRGAKALGPAPFSKALISLGFRKLHSDGHAYCGIKLAKPSASGGRRSK
jgi:hypothetical protein